MCRSCGFTHCAAGCPEDDGYDVYFGAPIGECDGCGQPIYENSRGLRCGWVRVCGECLQNAELDLVLELTGLSNARELLTELGFEE